jgi:hypothetical protein
MSRFWVGTYENADVKVQGRMVDILKKDRIAAVRVRVGLQEAGR